MRRVALATLFTLLLVGSATAQQLDSLRFKVGQMLVCGFRGVNIDEHMLMMLSRHYIGGVILFDRDVSNGGKERNIRNPQQVKDLIAVMQDLSSEKLLVAIDQEGGAVMRLRPAKGFCDSRSAKYLGELDDLDSTAYWAAVQAKQLKDLGINFNMAPCVDLAVNPNNPIIVKYGRSYGRDANKVIRHAERAVNEYNKLGIVTSLKHFPGHGSSDADSHLGIVDVTKTFVDDELEPYRYFIKNGYDDVVMMSHVIDRNVDTLPASLSRVFVDSVLRRELGYKGVIATDDLNMGGIADNFEYKRALELAINAGVDMIVIGNNGNSYRPKLIEITIIEILDLVKSGKISSSRIDQAYERIKTLKQRIN